MEKLLGRLIVLSTLIGLGVGHEYTKYTPEELLVIKQVNNFCLNILKIFIYLYRNIFFKRYDSLRDTTGPYEQMDF